MRRFDCKLSESDIFELLEREEFEPLGLGPNILAVADKARKYAESLGYTCDKEERLLWAKIAEKAYSLYRSGDHMDSSNCMFDLKRMNMRVKLINDYGIEKDTDILNINEISNWCRTILPELDAELLCSLEKIPPQKILNLDREVLTRLRDLRNRLGVCHNLKYCHTLSLAPDILKLLPLRDFLP